MGNVYVQFREEEHAANALRNLTERFYAGRPIIVDFSLVTDFLEATCRQYNVTVVDIATLLIMRTKICIQYYIILARFIEKKN
ncbi:hypothetical protein CsatA_001683 [Cannabis sativa]